MHNQMQYELSREHQHRLMHRAEQERLANQVRNASQANQSLSQAVKELRRQMNGLNRHWQEAREHDYPVELQPERY